MARIFTSGFELNSSTSGMEWGAYVVAPSTTNARTGSRCFRVSSLSSGTSKHARLQFLAAAGNGPYYFRAYYRFATLPTAQNRIMSISNSGTQNTAVVAYITIDNTGVLRLFDEDGQIGSASSALSTNTYYRIELKYDRTPAAGSQKVHALIDGVEFAGSDARDLSQGVLQFYVGGNMAAEAQTTGDWSIDDVAINDSTGLYQNGYPGSGKVLVLWPSAAGDINTFATQVGGTAGSGNNFTRVNENPPDDATTYNGSSTLNEEDLFNVTDSGLAAQDIVNVVAVGYRYANITAPDATAAFKVEIMKAPGGTKGQSSAVIPNSTSFRSYIGGGNPTTNTPYVMYIDPDGSWWQKATLDSMQIGYILSAANTRVIAISNVYAIVDYTPYTGSSNTPSNFQAFM